MERPTAIITGAGRGIGRATAVEFSRAGYDVVLAARDEAQLKQTADAARGGLVVPTDVTQPTEVNRLVERALKVFGRVDVVVNNAGFAPVRSIVEMTDDEWRAVLDTNLSAAFYLTRAAWPALSRRGGAVVNISSAAARDPFAGFAAYGAAKAGLNLFGLAAGREGVSAGVRVHTIAPAATETAMFRGLMDETQWPCEKTLDPADVAKAVLSCVQGDLRHTSGEVVYLHKTL